MKKIQVGEKVIGRIKGERRWGKRQVVGTLLETVNYGKFRRFIVKIDSIIGADTVACDKIRRAKRN